MQSLVPGVFLLPCIWKKLPVAGSVSIVSKDIRNPLSLPAHNKKAALQLIRRVFIHLIQASSYSFIDDLVKNEEGTSLFLLKNIVDIFLTIRYNA